MSGLMTFINGVKKEVSRIRWPNRKYMVKYSIAVLLCGAVLAAFFYVIDFVVAILINLFKVLLG